MKIYFDLNNLINRQKTEIKDELGNLLYWGIYDFSYKYRTRIFSNNDNELMYVQKDISKDDNIVNICDLKDTVIDYIHGDLLVNDNLKINGNYQTGDIEGLLHIEDGSMEILDDSKIDKCVAILFALVERERQ